MLNLANGPCKHGVHDGICWECSTFTLDELYRRIAQWQNETFPEATPASASEHLRREALELWACYWDDWEPGRPLIPKVKRPPHAERAEEAADVFMLLVKVCEADGIDLPAAVAKKLEKNKRRVWKAPDEHGVVEHESEGSDG